MKPTQLVLRCYAERDGDVWVASCLDFCLAAQGDSYEEVREKLEDMINEYVYDVTVGEDSDHAYILLSRKAPFATWVKYYIAKVQIHIGMLKHASKHLFTELLPLAPCNHGHA
jgi:predicted RNase H-like HicB family nuclease